MSTTPEDPRDDDGLPPLPPLPPHLRDRPDRPRTGPQIAQGKSQARLILVLLFAAIPMVVVFVIVLNSLATGPPDPSAGGAESTLNEVTRYCTYTAASNAAYNDCLDHTDYRVIQREKSNAARYARGQLMQCLPGSGFRCTIRGGG